MRKFILILLLLSMPSISWGAAADMAVTVAGAGDGSGTAGDGVTLEWDNAMSLAQFETDAGTGCSSEAGDRYFVMEGTYTLNESWDCANDGVVENPIMVIGVKSGTDAEPPTQADWAYGDARPLIEAASSGFTFYFDNGWHHYNLRVNTSASNGIRSDSNGVMYNIKSFNSSGTENRYALYAFSTGSKVLFCEAISTNGYGVYSYQGSVNLYNYVHDSNIGFNGTSNDGHTFIGNIIADNTEGFNASSGNHVLFLNNTFYNNTTAIDGGSNPAGVIAVNNIFDSNTAGASWGADRDNANVWDYNQWFNTADVVNITTGSNSVAGDALMNAPGSDDFTLTTGSPALDAGGRINTNVGVVGDYKWNIGVDQDDNASGGSSAVTTLRLNGVTIN